MILAKLARWLILALCAAPVDAQQPRGGPHMGYVYPAGGQQGCVVRVTIGGQGLRGITDAYISGQGVRARVVEHFPPLRNLSAEEREALTEALRTAISERWAQMHAEGSVGPTPPWRELALPARNRRDTARANQDTPTTQKAGLPAHPLLYDLRSKSLRELLHVRDAFLGFRKEQPTPQLAETVLVELTIDRDAAAGDRELRLGGRSGLSNPMLIQIGTFPEVCELERNDPQSKQILPEEPPLELPIVINGQIMPGDVDRFRFRARKGQKIVVEARARRLIPFLADAVPGWFQATLSLYDAQDKEIAYVDDYRFDPDPVVMYQVPADGEYRLEIRDSIYRGRQDFVYRIVAGERPFITSMFPLGARVGPGRYVAVEGWNLGPQRLFLKTDSQPDGVYERCPESGTRLFNRIAYAVDALPADDEAGDNDTRETAQRVSPPRIINGRIEPAGDVDVFQFKGAAGQQVVAEIVARRLNSPLDSLLRLTDAGGRALAWNDDHEQTDGTLHTGAGVQTHSADSYLRATLPEDGVYFVQVADSQEHGGPAYGYRLRLGPPQPDFALRAAPASVNVFAGSSSPITVYALRKDGFDGEIEVRLMDAPPGFELAGARIPPGLSHVRLTLAAPSKKKPGQPIVVQLEGRARIGKQTVTRAAVPAEDLMQAFLYRHLAPCHELMLAVLPARLPVSEITVDAAAPAQIPAGGTQRVRLNVPARLVERNIDLKLDQPPPGITLENVEREADGLVLVLRADAQAAQPGYADNLILACFYDAAGGEKDRKPDKQPSQTPAGFLPAIPFEVVSNEQ